MLVGSGANQKNNEIKLGDFESKGLKSPLY